MKYRVLVVDDQAMARQLFENIITQSECYTLVAGLDSAQLADIYCARGNVDLILMDVVMKHGINGLDMAAKLKKSYHATNMDEFYEKLQENITGDKLELTEINGQKAILQDRASTYIVRIATENPNMYVEITFTPNQPEILAEAGGNMADNAFLEVASELFSSDLFKTVCEGITIVQK